MDGRLLRESTLARYAKRLSQVKICPNDLLPLPCSKWESIQKNH